MWESRRAATLSAGDITPAGPIESVDYFGALRRVTLTIGGQAFDRGFDDLVDIHRAARCSCARNTDGTTTTSMCPIHADTDPCLTMSLVTGRRRKGSIIRGTCSSCGHRSASRRESVPA